MRLFSEQLAAILEDLVERLRIVPTQIDGQILGTQVQPAQNGVAGVVDLDQIPSVSGAAGQVAYFTASDTIASSPKFRWENATGAEQLYIEGTNDSADLVSIIANGGAGTAGLGVQQAADGALGITGGVTGANGIGMFFVASGAGGKALVVQAGGSATIAAEFVGSVDIDGALSLDDTGGTNHLLKQSTLGGVVTSGTLTDAEHGNRGGGTLHDVATTSVAGFLSAPDKTKLDGIDAANIAYEDEANTFTQPQTVQNYIDLSEVSPAAPAANVLRMYAVDTASLTLPAWQDNATTLRKAGGLACRARRTTNQSIATATRTAINLDAERYDRGGMHDNVTNNERITVPVAGLYHIGCNIQFAANATGRRIVEIWLNNTTVIARDDRNAVTVASAPTTLNIACDYQLAANDYVDVRVFQDSGGALDVVSSVAASPELWLHLIA